MLMLLCLQAASEDRVGRLVDGDLDDTTLAFFGFGGGKKEDAPKKAGKSKPAPKKEEDSGGSNYGFSLGNLLNQGGVTPKGYRPPGRGKRVLEAAPSQGFVQPPVARMAPPSMFRQGLLRAPLVAMIGVFVGSGITYALFRPRDESLNHMPLLSA